MARRCQHEAQEQEAFFNWAAYYPQLDYMYAVPNGGSRNKLEAVNLKRQGVKSGVPDICLPLPKGKWHGLYIEMKYGKNTASENQKKYIDYLNSVGYKAVVCYGYEAAKRVVTAYLKGIEVN
jgi:hypothetical protein